MTVFSELLFLRGFVIFVYLGLLSVAAFMDWNTRTIKDRFPIGIALLGFAALFLFPEHDAADRLIGAAAAAGPMLILALVKEGAFGGGDIKLMAAGGFFLGWRASLAAAWIGLTAAALYCVVLMLKRRLTFKDTIAFGPFLALGLGIASLWGDELAYMALI